MELIKQLQKDGIEKGLCKAYQALLERCGTVEKMAQLYIKGIDFCIKNDYPTLDFIRENFRGKCEQYGIYVDDVVSDLRNVPDLVFNGKCNAKLRYDGYSVSRIFARHNSRVYVYALENAYLTIDVFDNCHLTIAVAGSSAQVMVNKYGDAKVDCLGSGIRINSINKKTY